MLKVTSICEGYTLIFRGTLDFEIPPSDAEVKSALKKTNAKFLIIRVIAFNKFGQFECYVGNLPELRKYLNLRAIQLESEYLKSYDNKKYKNPFYFELVCYNVKPLNDKGMLFVKHGDSKIVVAIRGDEFDRDFANLYGVREFNIKEVQIGDLPAFAPNKEINL